MAGMGTTETPNRPAVYLAGPDGFTPLGLTWHRSVLVPAVTAAGLEPLSPWEGFDDEFEALAQMEAGEDRLDAYAELNAQLGVSNQGLIDRSAGMLAMLDGTDVDSGTAAEIGYGSAKGLVVVGVRTDLRTAGDNEGAVVNLQVEHFIRSSGGEVFRSLEPAVAFLASRLTA